MSKPISVAAIATAILLITTTTKVVICMFVLIRTRRLVTVGLRVAILGSSHQITSAVPMSKLLLGGQPARGGMMLMRQGNSLNLKSFRDA
jgi:hypothetical protein